MSTDRAGVNENVVAAPGKPKWHAPVLTEESMATATQNVFGPGIDAYESRDPASYGS